MSREHQKVQNEQKKNETIVSKIIVLIKSIANFAVKNAIKGQIKV